MPQPASSMLSLISCFLFVIFILRYKFEIALQDWRTAEVKTKAKCHTVCKENERVQDAVLDCKLGRGRVLTEKELIKLDSKRKKSEEAVRKCDLEYYSCTLKSERAR